MTVITLVSLLALIRNCISEAEVILELSGIIFGIITLFAGLVGLLLEIQYRCRFKEQIEVSLSDWHLELDPSNRMRITGILAVGNDPQTREVILSELQLRVTLLSATGLQNTAYKAHIFSQALSPPRADGYWEACTVQAGQPLQVKFWVEIPGRELNYPSSIELQAHTVLYGRRGQTSQVQSLVVPFSPCAALLTQVLGTDRDCRQTLPDGYLTTHPAQFHLPIYSKL